VKRRSRAKVLVLAEARHRDRLTWSAIARTGTV